MEPKGKVAVITGGASGIGLATAKLLAVNGARVVIGDLQSDLGSQAAGDILAEGGEARFVHADVTKRDDLQGMLDFAATHFGRVDIMHNNAGISEGGDLLAPASEAWEPTASHHLCWHWLSRP